MSEIHKSRAKIHRLKLKKQIERKYEKVSIVATDVQTNRLLLGQMRLLKQVAAHTIQIDSV